MGLTTTFQNGAAAVFSAFGDVRTSVTYSSQSKPTEASAVVYDPATGVATQVFTDYTLNVFILPMALISRPLEGFSRDTVQEGDKKILMQGKDLAFTPQPGDRITEGTIVWNSVAVNVDPASALYTIHARRA